MMAETREHFRSVWGVVKAKCKEGVCTMVRGVGLIASFSMCKVRQLARRHSFEMREGCIVFTLRMQYKSSYRIRRQNMCSISMLIQAKFCAYARNFS
jgi:hypothetical protein